MSTISSEGEEHILLFGPIRLKLFLHHISPIDQEKQRASRGVLYIHGSTFPSALSVAFPFDGSSWMERLAQAGYDVWALDFIGFGKSDRYPEMDAPAEEHAALGRANEAWQQIAQAVEYIVQRQNVERLSIIAHSWGTIAACIFAEKTPQQIERLVLFAPITLRQPTTTASFTLPAYSAVSLAAQWKRFTEDVPMGESPVLLQQNFSSSTRLLRDL